MDLISNVFYRSHFDVFPVKAGWNVFIEITKYIINWCNFKAKRYGIELNWDWKQFRHHGIFEAGSMRAMSTQFVDRESGARYWAAKVFETVKCDGYADRTWISEFGIEQSNSNCATFSYTVMYEDRQGFLGELQPAPSANVPSVVNYLLTDKMVICKSGQQVLKLSPHDITPGHMDKLRDALQDVSRTCPIIYIAANKMGEHLFDRNELARLVAGNAKVFYSQYPSASDEFNSTIGNIFRCPDGGLRVYQPNIDWTNCDEGYRHIYFTEEKLCEIGLDKIQSILRRALCENIQYYTAKQLFRYDDCISMYNLFRRKEMQDLAAQAQDNEFLFIDEARQLQEAKSELEKVNYELQTALDACELEKQKNVALTNSLNETASLRETVKQLKHTQSKMSTLKALPQSPEEIVDTFLSIHSDKMDFTKRGLNSLRDCPTSGTLLWQVLFCMATTLRDLYILDSGKNIVQSFEQKTNFSLALTEGHETRKNNSLMSLREDTYAGDKIDIEPHVSYGNFRGDKSKSVRVYYAFDPKSKKIIIGFCGEHLPNYSTKNFK